MGNCAIPEKDARESLLLPVKEHYMGLNFDLFWQSGQLNSIFSMRTEKKRFCERIFSKPVMPKTRGPGHPMNVIPTLTRARSECGRYLRGAMKFLIPHDFDFAQILYITMICRTDREKCHRIKFS